MMQKHRIRTEIGDNQKLTVELKQDYDLLEILSLKFSQKDAYTSLCADYGVVCGRISANQGFGVANARVSIFIPLDDVDEQDPVVSALYPYKLTQDTNTDGYKYNLFPKRKQHTGHTPTGTFPDQEDILTREEELYVYEKYYKYTVKTNDAGDFMIWGVPVGKQTIHVDVDLSDMGCQSLVPYDFIYEGVSEEKFENNYSFRSSSDIGSLPQTLTFEESLEVYPFWGNEDLCEIGITRTDYDLSDQGIRIEPYSIMMGGTFTDSGKDSVRVGCNVDNQMGEKCGLISAEGDIETIRFSGYYEENTDGTPNYERPILEALQLDSQIDKEGNFFFRVPMNMGYRITNEFGELVETKDTQRGIPTRGTYRFRLSMQNDNGARKQYRGKYLIPQLKEHQLSGNIHPKAYPFSDNLDDYPSDSHDDITGINNNGFANDMFYSFRYNRIYTVSSFINQYHNKSWGEKTFPFFARDRNESFIGIKEIQPSIEEDCSNNNEYFPITDAVRNHKFKFLITTILNFLERLYLIITQFAFDFIVEFIFDIAEILYGIKIPVVKVRPFRNTARNVARFGRQIQIATIRNLELINYPDCYECSKDPLTGSDGTPGGDTYEIILVDNNGDTILYPSNTTSSGLESTVNSLGLTAVNSNLTTAHLYDPNDGSSDGAPDYLNLNITGGHPDKNYIIKFIVAPEEGYYDPNTGDYVMTSPTVFSYRFIGYGSDNPVNSSITGRYDGLAYDLFTTYYDYHNTDMSGTITDNFPGTVLSAQNQITIHTVYFYAEKQINTTSNELEESGCSKYDTIYDPDNDMNLRAFVNNSGGTNDYNYWIGQGTQGSTYPDIFIDTEDPCNYTPPAFDIVASISAWAKEAGKTGDPYTMRRCRIKEGYTQDRETGLPSGTASGNSEFRDGVYTLIAAAGKNRAMILNYSRRKLLGKLMCGGITSYTFSNSWLNGSLYFFQFRRRKGGNNAKYCKDVIHREEDHTGVHYYYRSTPYDGTNFIGGRNTEAGQNDPEILFPTTIMDLGPRNMFIKEICVDPELDVNCSVSKSIGNTSYQDINDLMEWVISSKEVKERGKLKVQDLFDKRGNGSMDGDIVQLLNFNSQLGIYGYDDEDQDSPYFPVNGAEYFDGVGPLSLNFRFSEDDEDTAIVEKDGTLLRICINAAGNLTETAQDIPYYRWDKKGDGFGGLVTTGTNSNNETTYTVTNSETQDWSRNTIYSTKYQGGWDFTGLMEPDPYGDAGGPPTEVINSHYYDGSILPPFRECSDDNYSPNEVPLGGPFFFYFGLRTGKSSWNKFIKNFGPL
tara:strand:+ start:20630 stop:24514 length:3885 start_codon:yes stop_codon:yes gene_type:complete